MLDRFKKSFPFVSLMLLLVVWWVPVHAAIKPVGEVVVTDGTFLAIQPDASTRSLARGSEFYRGDRLWTGPRTKAQIRFSDGAIMTLRPDTEFSVDEYEFDDKNAGRNKSLFTLVKGGFRTLTGLISRLRPDSYKVKTAYAIVGVRGTTFETVVDSGLYVAAWQGTVSVVNDKGEVLLGFGQDYSFASVASATSAPTGQLLTPPPLQQSVDPGLQEEVLDTTENRLVASLQDPIARIAPERLSPTELASLNRSGFAAFAGAGTGSPLRGQANDLATGANPIIFDQRVGVDVVLRQGSAPASGVNVDNTTFPGFPVSWGRWDATAANPATLQPDPLDGSVIQDVTTPVYWIVLTPAISLPATGAVSYNKVLSFSGSGSSGAVLALTFDAKLDFASGALNGTIIVDNSDLWNVNFSGTLLVGATADPATSTFNSIAGVTGTLDGTLTGSASGFGAFAPLGIGGVFDFEFGPNDVAGTFLARHDARFFAGEKATVLASAQSGFAAFGGTGVAPFTGQTTDGAGGSPILFNPTLGGLDGTALRQDGAPAINLGTNTTLGAGFPVSFGEWDGGTSPAALLPDPDGNITAVNDSVFWMTLFPANSVPTGTVSVSYNNVLNFAGDGTGGVVTGLSLDGTLDFGTGALNGNMLITNADTWDVNFSGGISVAQFTATAGASSTFNGTPGVTGSLTGSLTGNASGFGALAPLGLGGVFDFAFGPNDVAGTFLARHDGRFFAGEVASLDRPGFAAFGGPGTTLFSGTADDGASGVPIVFDQLGDQVLRRVSPSVGDTVVANFAGFNASFGSWDGVASAAAILPDPDGFVINPVSSDVNWITLQPPASLPVGSVAYFASGATVGATGSGSGGPLVTVSRFQTDIDFSSGALSNGRMAVLNGANTWDAFFNGAVTAGSFTASLTAGSNVNGSAAVGGLEGAFTENGAAISGIGGVFDFEESGVPTNNVQGAFVAREDRRFNIGELATLNQVAVAAFSGPTARAPLIGEASDGSLGVPIVFDVAANEVLRQGAAGVASVVPDTTTLGPSFPVSWGEWNASLATPASIQGNPDTVAVTQAITDPVFWITAIPASVPATGTAVYNTIVPGGFQGRGDGGNVNFVSINSTVNFGTAAVNGNMIVQNGISPTDTWNANFSGSLNGASVKATLNPVTSTFSDGGLPPVIGVTGSVNGALTGPPTSVVGQAGPHGMAGAFDFRCADCVTLGVTNHVQGTVFATQ